VSDVKLSEKRRFDVASIPGARAELNAMYRKYAEAEEAYKARLATTLGDGEYSLNASVIRHCPLCASDSYELFLQTRGLEIVSCSGCGHVYSRNVIRADIDRDRYRQADSPIAECYPSLKASSFYASIESARNDYYVGLCEQFVVGDKGGWLDIGSGNGSLLRNAFQRGWRVSGVEPNPIWKNSEEYSGIPLSTGFFPDDLPGGVKYECISLLDVLEHQEDPVALLKAVYNVLLPGGVVFVQVPNLNSLLIQVEGAASSIFCPGHWGYFDSAHLAEAGRQAGLELLETDTVITELDRISTYDDMRVRTSLEKLTRREWPDSTNLADVDIYQYGLGYKLLGLFRKG
jgi:SAM-dependent methyltransferase